MAPDWREMQWFGRSALGLRESPAKAAARSGALIRAERPGHTHEGSVLMR
jgi:hypothetical protein